ncbi:MAG: tyrosine-type recombinase/integrase [Victivallales bacterium]|nr:tyrosine-type recombinase/integrase [Victivallales bacterium]
MADEIIKERLDKGTLYQKQAGGLFYLRYQINGSRKAVSLKTKNYKDAKAKAEALIPTLASTTVDLIEAHAKEARGYLEPGRNALTLADAWDVYSKHPERAMPATVSEQQAYKRTWDDFLAFVGDILMPVSQITYENARKYAEHLKNDLSQAVDSHNRKINRLRKIFSTLKGYYQGENPFGSSTLKRKNREESNLGVHRLGFTAEQEAKLLEVLDDPTKKVKHKDEIRVVFYLGLFTGQRLKDNCLLRWNKVDLNAGKIWVKQFKTGKEVVIPIAPQLKAQLQIALQWKTTAESYVCPNVAERYCHADENGKVRGADLLDKDVLRVIKWIGVEPSVKVEGRAKAITVYGFHSLRHSFASHAAENGVPRAVLQAILGDNADIIDHYYTHIGEEALQDAVQAISGRIGVVTPQERINKVLELLLSYEEKKVSTDASELIRQIKKLLTT